MKPIIFLFAAFVTTTIVAAQSCYHGEVRLVGGLSPNQGRVEVCVNGAWGTVTDDGFYIPDAKVVCRQLGYPVDDPGASTTYRCCAHYGRGSGAIHLDAVGCGGTEASLVECYYRNPSSSSDSHSEDVGVICPTCGPDGAIRLSNGLAPEEGIVEICFGGIWRSVCTSYWDHKDAFVVCRQLGYPATAAYAFYYAYFGEHPRPHISRVLCYGNESKLLDCGYTNTTSCSPANTAGVRCQGETIPDPPCTESTVRLTGGQDEHEGRVEVCSNGVWGTICGGLWDYNDTFVLCRQLGYQNPRVFVYRSSSFFGQGNGPILYDDLTCDSTELALTQCSSDSPSQVTCSHGSDVGARCEEMSTTVIDTCDDGDIRLMDGRSTAEGRVEICINNIWGSVCDDGWDVIDAGVVCSQIGFQSANATAYRSAYFGRSAGPYILDDVRCVGDELILLECSHRGTFFHDCIPGKDAGVKCEDVRYPVLHKDHGQELFQVQVGPVEHCVTWDTEKATALENSIQKAVISVIENYCECMFPASNIDPGQFICSMTTEEVTYRSTILGTIGNNATQLLAILQDWVASGPVIKLDWKLLRVSPGCPTRIASMADPECSLSEPTHTMFDDPTLITSDSKVIKCVNACLYRKQGHGICGAY